MRRTTPPRFDTQTRIEVAMCLWEAVLDQLRVRNDSKWNRLCDEIGTCEMRSHVSTLVDHAEWTWREAAREFEYGSPFDWEWCPVFLELATDARCQLRRDALPIMLAFARKESQS